MSDSSWLSANPSNDNYTALTKDEFKISLFLRHNLPAPNLPSKCNGYGQPFTIEDALCCKIGGLITARHDHLKFELANLLGNVLPQSYVKIEPTLPYAADQYGSNRLVSDASARNIWKDNKISIFDIQLTYSFCKSNTKSDATKLLKTEEKHKKSKCMKRCRECNLNFTPYVATANLMLDDEFKRVIKNIPERLEQKWKKNYMNFRTSLAIIRGASRCIAGIRMKIEGCSFESKDGEDIELLLC